MTRFPIYIPSRGRCPNMTADNLRRDKVPFSLVVEPPEADQYIEEYGAERVLVLPFQDLGCVVPARNWIWDHAVESGAERHWQLDDNLIEFRRLYKGRRIPCSSGLALKVCEDFTERYSNIGLSGLNYQMFVTGGVGSAPFGLNVHVYSCTLISHALPFRFRGRSNEDVDLCLQTLVGGFCTVLLNAFMANKQRTMVARGGNSDTIYSTADSRLKITRGLERVWPGVVKTKRRFGRPHHVIDWRRFDTPLQRREDIDWSAIEDARPRTVLTRVSDIESPAIRGLLEEHRGE